jgi:hypothetical protein
MAERASGRCPERRVSGILDLDEFAQEVRQLAMDTHKSLTRLGTTVDELIGLKRRFEELLRQTQAPGAAEINRWLRNAYRMILARLHPEPVDGMRVRLDRREPPIGRAHLRRTRSAPELVAPDAPISPTGLKHDGDRH